MSLALLWFVGLVRCGLGALPPLSMEGLTALSQAVIIGTVHGPINSTLVHRGVDTTDTHFTATVVVESLEEDINLDLQQQIRPGDTLVLTYWRVASRPSGWAGPSGQTHLPSAGDRGSFYLGKVSAESQWPLLDPNGWASLAQPDRLVICRQVTKEEASWLDRTLEPGEVVWQYHGYTYNVISRKGVAVTSEHATEPFLEVPRNAIWWSGQHMVAGEFPASWGDQPSGGRRDYVSLPAGFGHGGSAVRQWILDNLSRECGKPMSFDDDNSMRLRRTQRL